MSNALAVEKANQLLADTLTQMQPDMPRVVDCPIPQKEGDQTEWRYRHVQVIGDGSTAETTIADWRGKLMAYLENERADWIYFRGKPCIAMGHDFATGLVQWAVFSRIITPFCEVSASEAPA